MVGSVIKMLETKKNRALKENRQKDADLAQREIDLIKEEHNLED